MSKAWGSQQLSKLRMKTAVTSSEKMIARAPAVGSTPHLKCCASQASQ